MCTTDNGFVANQFSYYLQLQVKVREGGTDWGWGVVVNVVERRSAGPSSSGSAYIVDTLLHCSPGSNESGSRPKPCPPRRGEKGEMHVVCHCKKFLYFLA